MKGFLTILLLLLFSVQTFSKWMWVLDYNLNQTYIATALCINKAKPKLHCNGACQLTKKLAEDEKDNKDSGTATQKSLLNSAFFKPDMEADLAPWIPALVQLEAVYVLKPYPYETTSVFHPPSV